MARKTIEVEEVKNRANAFLALDSQGDSDPAFRCGVISMLEVVLFSTENYKGFSYLASEWDESKGELREGYDQTRRRYH